MMVDEAVEAEGEGEGRVLSEDEVRGISAGIQALMDRAQEMGYEDAKVMIEDGLMKLMEEWD